MTEKKGIFDSMSSVSPNLPTTASQYSLSLAEALKRLSEFSSSGQQQEAEQLCRDILRSIPDQIDARGWFGSVAWRDGRSGLAERLLRQSLSLRPDQINLLYNYAIILRSLGRLHEARNCIKRALILDPNFSSAQKLLSAIGSHKISYPIFTGQSRAEPFPRKMDNTLYQNFINLSREFVKTTSMPFGDLIIQFIIDNPNIFNNRFILPFTHHAFGHNIMVLDWCARTHYPSRVSVVIVPGIRDNPYLPLCFQYALDIFRFEIPLEHRNITNENKICDGIRSILLLYTSLHATSGEVINILNFFQIYGNSPRVEEVLTGNEEMSYFSTDTNLTGYCSLIENNVGKSARLPNSDLEFCRERIESAYPGFFDKPIVSLLLRSKGHPRMFSDFSRSSGPQENYIPLVEHFSASGFHVIGTGETNHEIFRHIDGYFDLSNADIPSKLLNVFVLTNCVLFVGQHSGTYMLSGSAGALCLLTDALPHRLGTFGRGDIILHKKLKLPGRLSPLSLLEVYRDHPDLASGVNFAAKGAWYETNSPDEILDAGREAIRQIREPDSIDPEIVDLANRLRSAIPSYMPVAHYASRPPASVLRTLRSELLALSK